MSGDEIHEMVEQKKADISGNMMKHKHTYFNELKEKHKMKFQEDKSLFTFLSIMALKKQVI